MGGVWRTAKRTKRTSYGRNGGPVHREGCGVPQNGTPRDTVHLHRRPPPASTGSCSSSLHRALLHRLLFNHPSTGTPPPSTVHPALHTTGSCSTTTPRAPLHRLLFIQPSTTPRGPVHPEATPPLTVHPNPPCNAHCSSNRSASVSSSSEGIARSGSVNSHRSIAQVQ